MGVEILNIDCMEYMRTQKDNAFDLAIVDPPYFEGPNKKGYYGKGFSNLGVERARHYSNLESWSVPEAEYFKELKRVSINQIIWGANHFSGVFDSSSSCWVVWDKDNGASSFADAELAYTSFNTAVRIYKYLWNGMHQGQMGGSHKHKEKRIHPTQKPINLYLWLLATFSKPGDRVLDTHLGSASSAVAAHYFGCDFVGTEIDTEMFKASESRYRKDTAQEDAFYAAGVVG